MTSKHTPGPWYVDTQRGDLAVTARPSAFVVADVTFPKSPESVHNARLIAAAPEMLEALHALTECVSMPGPHGGKVYAISDERMAIARAILARLEGGK